MFNLSFSHLVVIMVAALIFIGPQQLPEVARTLGRLLNELRRATGDLSQSFWDMKNAPRDYLKQAQNIINEPPPPPPQLPESTGGSEGSQPPPQQPPV